MPKAVDKHPQARGVGNSLYDPRKSTLASWNDPMSAIDEEVHQIGDNLQRALAGAIQTIKDITGIELTPAGLTSLIGQIIPKILAAFGGFNLDENNPIIAGLARLLTGDPLAAVEEQIELWRRRLITAFTPVHVSRITDTPINLLDDPNFELADSISPVDGWTRDGIRSATGVGGSAKVICDGSLKRLFHRTIIANAVAGKTYNLSGKIETEDLAVTDLTEISLAIVEYHGTAMGDIVDVATRTTGSATWVTLSGNYTVPAGVTALGVCMSVVGATDGSVWFSNLNLHETDKMPRTYVNGLDELRENIESLFSHVDLTIGPEDFEPGIAVLTAAIDDAGARIRDLLDGLRNAFVFNLPAASSVTVDQVTFAASEVRQKIITTQDSVITVANLADQPKNRPWWESPSPFEEVSVPRVLMQPRFNPSTSAYDIKPSVTLASGTLHLIPQRMRDNQIINEVGILSLGDDPPPTALYLGLYSVDPVTGNHTLVYDFGDVKGDIDTGPEMLYEQRFQTTLDILGPAGEIFAVGILPIGGSFRVAGVMRDQIITSFTLYPQSSTEVLTGQTSLPSTVTETSLNHTFGYRVFASIGQTFTGAPDDETLLTLTETFNVPPTNGWASPSWLRFLTASSKLYVDGSGGIRAGTTGVAGGDSTFWGAALAKTKLNTNDQSVELTIGDNTWSAGAYGYVTMRGYVRCKSDGSSGACMHVDSNGVGAGAGRVRIANTTAMYGLGTVRATVTGLTIASTDRFRLEAVGDTYTVYQNDVAIPGAVWTDVGGLIVPVGKTWRYVGWGHGERTTVGSFWRMAALDQWVGKDVAA